MAGGRRIVVGDDTAFPEPDISITTVNSRLPEPPISAVAWQAVLH